MGTGKMKKMSRQQQKAVGASMNEAASGKGAPNKMIVNPNQQLGNQDLSSKLDAIQQDLQALDPSNANLTQDLSKPLPVEDEKANSLQQSSALAMIKNILKSKK
jgi:hypothetical protein